VHAHSYTSLLDGCPRRLLNERNAMRATRISGTEVSEGTPRVALVSTKTTTPKTVSNPTTATTHGLRVRPPRFYAQQPVEGAGIVTPTPRP
jgi:hypothetical protein